MRRKRDFPGTYAELPRRALQGRRQRHPLVDLEESPADLVEKDRIGLVVERRQCRQPASHQGADGGANDEIRVDAHLPHRREYADVRRAAEDAAARDEDDARLFARQVVELVDERPIARLRR